MPDSSVGQFRVPIEFASHPAGPFRRIQALVDTGATYTWLPGELLEDLGMTPDEERVFVLADGRERSYGIGWTHVRVAGRKAQPTIVVFGESGSEALLGAFTLEGFGLAADPLNRRLIPVPGLLKSA